MRITGRLRADAHAWLATSRASRCSSLGSRVWRQSVSAVRITIRAGRSGSTYRKINDVVTIASAISQAGKRSTVQREQVVDEHEERHQQHEQPVLGIRQLDRKRVAGRPEVDQAGPVDVVVGAQPHLCRSARLFEDQVDQVIAEEEAASPRPR